MVPRRWWIAIALVAACHGHADRTTNANGSAAVPAPVTADKDTDGLVLKLSNGTQGAPAYDRATLAPTTKLGDAEIAAVLARAKPFVEAAEPQAFALRPGSTPPPQVGETIKTAFPPPPSSLLPPASTRGSELHVTRSTPEGPVPHAPELTVTFDQPMVAVTSQGDAAKTQPVKLTPAPQGHWRWIGTRTIVFDPQGSRFPQATTYTVEVPAGTKSATGAVLAKPVTFSFETAPPVVVETYPEGGSQNLDVPMFVRFDQKIDRQRAIAAVRITATAEGTRDPNDPWSQGKPAPVHVELVDATKSTDVGLVARLAQLTKDDDGTWFVMRSTSPLPADADVHVAIGTGMRSAEGPNPTKAPQTFEFHTRPPLRVESSTCGDGEHCRPDQEWQIEFTNPLDAKFDPARVSITPAIADVHITAAGREITIDGPTQPRTKYAVKIAAGLRDTFGQTLAKDAAVAFDVGDSEPSFVGPDGTVVLDPMAKPALSYFTTNYDSLGVKLYRVSPGDYVQFQRYVASAWPGAPHPKPVPGTLVVDTTVKTTPGANILAETSVALDKVLPEGRGQVIAIVTPSPWTDHDMPQPRLTSWVQATNLAVDAYVDRDQLVAFATDLTTGNAIAGASIVLEPSKITGTTDERGLATLPLPARAADSTEYLIARHGNDLTLLDGSGWSKEPRSTQLTWSVTDDRKMYRPGETVTIKGWLRAVDFGKHGDVGGIAGKVTTVTYKVFDQEAVQIATGTAKVGGLGGFDLHFALPKTPNLGEASIQLTAHGALSGEFSHEFQIEEFRRPEFEVSAHTTNGPFVIGGAAELAVDASYYAGGPLPGAATTWSLSASSTSFTPPNRDDFTFGSWEPWWESRRFKPSQHWQHTARTDGAGSHALHVELVSMKPAIAQTVTAQVSVTDTNNQQWSTSTSFVVHPSLRYVGLRTKKPFVEQGTPYDVDVIGVDLDGKATPGAKIDLETVRLEGAYVRGEYVTKDVDPQHCAVVAAKDPVACHLATAKGGRYEIRATIVDDKGRPNRTVRDFWVSGGDEQPVREVIQETVQLVPDRKDYAPGTTAEILVRSPFAPAEGVVTWRRSGIVKMERITLAKPSTVITVPITDDLVPNLTVQVDLAGTAPRIDPTASPSGDAGGRAQGPAVDPTASPSGDADGRAQGPAVNLTASPSGDAAGRAQGPAVDAHDRPDPTLPRRPAFATGTIDLSVPPKQRELAVTVAPNAAKLGPGESGMLAIAVADAEGKPVPDAEVTVFVVDEAILALSGFQFENPLASFYPHRGTDTRDYYLRSSIHLVGPDAHNFGFGRSGFGPGGGGTGWGTIGTGRYGTIGHGAGTGSGYGVGGGRGGMRPRPPAKATLRREDPKPEPRAKMEDTDKTPDRDSDGIPDAADVETAPIAVRSNFDPLATFVSAAKTGADGKVTVDFKVPDNLTRYRIVAIAASGEKRFGKGESAVTARLPLMVRPSPPRFLNFGDTFQLPVVVQNQTDAPMTVNLAIRASNLALTDGAGRSVVVPPNDRALVEFPAAAQLAGTARLQIVGAADHASDAAQLELPVWTPATTEAFATYGVLDRGAVKQPVALPGQVVTQFGGLEVSTSSTNLQALTDALLYIVHYPFECSEQRSSRILAIAALRDVLSAFHAKNLPSPAAMERSVAVDVEKLAQMQNDDGGFAFWEKGTDSMPYLGIYVANALAHAKAKGYAVSPDVIARSLSYLREIDTRIPAFYSRDTRLSLDAFALYTRKLLGDVDVARAKLLIGVAGGVDKLPIETAGWILGVLAGQPTAAAERAAILTYLTNHVTETAGAAMFTTTSYAEQGYLLLASDTRVDGVVLESLMEEKKDSDLIPKLVAGLMASRKAGRWQSTQDNAFVLLALDRYFHTYENVTPDFVARVWLGNDYAGDHAFHGHTTETNEIDIAMTDVAAHGASDLTIQNDGKGRLYYRIGMTYAPKSLQIDAADYGFVVERHYEAVDDPKDVTRDAAGTWHVKAGARVRIKLSLVNEARRFHVALVDPMPAGFEAMNPALAVTGTIPSDPKDQQARGAYWWWASSWYEHQNMRDERVEAFASELWEGVHPYEYVARATTRGTYAVPPPKAEEMYMPETFGRGASDRVIIE